MSPKTAYAIQQVIERQTALLAADLEFVSATNAILHDLPFVEEQSKVRNSTMISESSRLEILRLLVNNSGNAMLDSIDILEVATKFENFVCNGGGAPLVAEPDAEVPEPSLPLVVWHALCVSGTDNTIYYRNRQKGPSSLTPPHDVVAFCNSRDVHMCVSSPSGLRRYTPEDGQA